MANVTTIYYGVSCQPPDASFLVSSLAYFSFYPTWILLFNSIISLIDADLYFYVASLLILTTTYVYTSIIASLLRFERPTSYNYVQCQATQYAFPDATFVAALSYSLIVAVGLWQDKRLHPRLSLLRVLWFAAAMLGYIASTIVTNYFSWSLLLANVAVTLFISGTFVFLYRMFVHAYMSDTSSALRNEMGIVTRCVGCSSTMFVSHKQIQQYQSNRVR